MGEGRVLACDACCAGWPTAHTTQATPHTMGGKKGKSKKAGGRSKPTAPQPDPQHDAAGNKGSGLGLASMPGPWLHSVASCLVQHGRAALFRACRVMLRHPGCALGLCLLRSEALTSQHVLEESVAMIEKNGGFVALNAVIPDGFRGMNQMTLTRVLTGACSLVGPDCQQLTAITNLSCGGTDEHTWYLENSLVPEFLVKLCPNLQTLHLQHVCVGSLPQPADETASDAFVHLKLLSIEGIQLAESITADMMAHQARRFPALTSLSLAGDRTDSFALAGLTIALSQQLTYLKLIFFEMTQASDWHLIFLPETTVYPRLQEASLDVLGLCPVSSLSHLPLVLPALQRLHLGVVYVPQLTEISMRWLQQIKHLSCSFVLLPLCDDASESSDASIIACLEACGGLYLTKQASTVPTFGMCERSSLTFLILPYIHFTSTCITYRAEVALNSTELAAFGKHFKCSYVRINAQVEPEALEDLPRLLPDACEVGFGHWYDDQLPALLRMCKKTKRRMSLAICGDDEAYYRRAQHVADAVRKVAPSYKVRVFWETNGRTILC